MSTLRTNTLQDASGGNSVAMATVAAGTAKAWVNFNGTGTVAIRASFNVSGITDLGTGYYRVNFTSAMSGTGYSVLTTTAGASTGEASRIVAIRGATTTGATGKTTSYIEVISGFGWAGGTEDNAEVNVAVFI